MFWDYAPEGQDNALALHLIRDLAEKVVNAIEAFETVSHQQMAPI